MAGDAQLHPVLGIERAPGGWAVTHAPSGRSWTLIREDTARRLAAIANAATTERRVERVLRKLQREASRPSHRRLVAIHAANELLDAAAAHCFRDPVAATDLVRWNHMRRQPQQVAADLDRGPAAFGELRITREAAELWSRLPEPRHAHLPAWVRFREAAQLWLEVQQGRDWSPPAAFPPPPPPPQAPSAPAPGRMDPHPVPAPAPARYHAPAPPGSPQHPRPRGRSPGPGLSF